MEFNFKAEEPKRIITPIFTPSKNLIIIGELLKKLYEIDMSVIITNEGRTIPRVETRAPKKPFILYPINVAQLIDTGPGVHYEIENISSISSVVMNLCFSLISFSMKGIIEYPPPKVKSPILKNILNRINKLLFFKN